MESYRGLKFRIYPDKRQQEIINQIISNSNFVYNYYIRKQQETFHESGKFLSLSQCIKELPELKRKYPELKEGESTSLQQTLRHLDRAYNNFFEKRSQYPRYKSNNFDHSYTCTKNGCNPSNIRMEGDFLILPKLGRVKIKLHRPIPEESDITSATVKITPSGKYEVTLHVKTEKAVKENKCTKVAGLVYSKETFFISSEGEYGEIPENYLKNQKKIKRIKKNIKRKKEGSANRLKENNKLKKAYKRGDNIKKDYLHKWSRKLADDYDVIGVLKEEELSIKAKHEGWNQFIQMLSYKLEDKGGKLIIIGHQDLIDFPLDERASLAKKVAQLVQV